MSHLCDHTNGARGGPRQARINLMIDPQSSRGLMATIAEIDAAGDEAMLRAAVKRAQQAVVAELGGHTPTPTLAAAWSEAMRTTVATTARLVATAAAGTARPRWTWFVSGSVGRGEAVPGSDVETLVALADDVDDEGKTHALTLAAEVHSLLEACGLSLDDNGVLGSRLRFCRRDVSWADGIERWAAQPDQDRGVVMLGLLADAWSVTEVERRERLRPHVLAAVGRHPIARKSMLQDATSVRSSIPSRLRIFATQVDRADLKSAVIDTDDASSLQDCYVALSRIRWHLRTAPWLSGQRVDDVVSMADLAPQERATLRTIAHEVNGVRRKLEFLSSMPS